VTQKSWEKFICMFFDKAEEIYIYTYIYACAQTQHNKRRLNDKDSCILMSALNFDKLKIKREYIIAQRLIKKVHQVKIRHNLLINHSPIR